MQFVFFYLTSDNPDRIREVAARHASYWHGLALDGYRGGPLADRTGGLITFEVATAEEADLLVNADPFLREGLLTRWWLREWLPESAEPPDSRAGLVCDPTAGRRRPEIDDHEPF